VAVRYLRDRGPVADWRPFHVLDGRAFLGLPRFKPRRERRWRWRRAASRDLREAHGLRGQLKQRVPLTIVAAGLVDLAGQLDALGLFDPRDEMGVSREPAARSAEERRVLAELVGGHAPERSATPATITTLSTPLTRLDLSTVGLPTRPRDSQPPWRGLSAIVLTCSRAGRAK